MQGTEIAVEVPHDDTLGKFTRSGITDSFGVVCRAYPLSPKFAARAVSPTTKTTMSGFSTLCPFHMSPSRASRPIG
jgi:hypothetical protein